MQGGNGKNKVTGSSNAEDGNSVGKENKERSWKSHPIPQTYTKVLDVGSSQKDKGTPSSTPTPVTSVLTISPLKEQSVFSKNKKVDFKRCYDLRSQIYSLEHSNEGVSSGGLALNSSQKPRLGRKTLLSKEHI